MEPWVWAILLLILGMGLAVLEVFFPSGGVLGFLTVCAVIGAVIMGFQSGAAVGMGIVVTAILGLPLIIVMALKYWPHTSVGRRMLLGAPSSDDVLPDSPERKRKKELLGKIGRAKSQMLPAGAITMDGKTIDAVTEGMAVEPGQPVAVVEVRANRVVVRPVADVPPVQPGDDLMAQPIEDPFEEESA